MTALRNTDGVLVGPLQPTGRPAPLLAALDRLPRAQQVVLRAGYLEGVAPVDLAARLLLTERELALVLRRAVAGLAATHRPAARTLAPRAHPFAVS